MKICKICNLNKNLIEYHKRHNNLLRSECKDCVKEYGIKYRQKNKNLINFKKKLYNKNNPHIKRRSYLRLEYGITLEDYNKLLISQNNLCAICKSINVKNIQHKHLHIDHCHKTGKIRGILCSRCNAGLGHFEDNIELFKQAIIYLEKNNESN